MKIAAEIEESFPTLNPEQRSIVQTTDGPLLIIAGPGSGKTFSLVLRALNMLCLGKAKPAERAVGISPASRFLPLQKIGEDVGFLNHDSARRCSISSISMLFQTISASIAEAAAFITGKSINCGSSLALQAAARMFAIPPARSAGTRKVKRLRFAVIFCSVCGVSPVAINSSSTRVTIAATIFLETRAARPSNVRSLSLSGSKAGSSSNSFS